MIARIRTRRAPILAAAYLSLVVLMAGCGPASPSDSEGETPGGADTPQAGQTPTTTMQTSVSGIPLDPASKRGGTLVAAAQSEGPSFSPWEEAGGIAFIAGQPLTNMLIQPRSWGTAEDYNNKAYLELAPDLAESWEQSPDGLAWTFRIREGITWSDGQPLTCADAKWSLDSIRSGEGLQRSPRAIHMLAIDQTACPDDRTLVVTLKRPKPGFIEVIGMPYHAILPKHRYEGNTEEMRTKPLIGTGPFVLQEWVPGEGYTFVRRDDYWNEPFPYLDAIKVNIISLSAQATALRANRIDIGPAQGFQGGGAVQLTQECAHCQVFDKVVAMGVDPALMVNHNRPPWNDPLVKDAISLAIDRKKIVDVTFQGWADPVTGGIFYPGSYWAMPKELLATIPGYDLDHPEENKQKARELLRQAGYAPGELQIPLDVGVYSVDEVPVLVEDLEAVGFKVTPTNHEVGRTYELMSAGNFDVFVHGFWTSGIDADFQLYEQFYTGSDRNYNRYSNPEFDRLVDEMSQTLDPEARRQKAWDAAEMALRDHAKFFLAMQSYTPIVGGRVRGFMPSIAFQAAYGPTLRWEHVWLAE